MVGQYRANAGVTNRAELRALRAAADDALAYLEALKEQRVSGGSDGVVGCCFSLPR